MLVYKIQYIGINKGGLNIISLLIFTRYFNSYFSTLRTRTPTGGIQRSGSNLAANSRTANSSTTTAYGADGSRVTTTRSSTSYSSNAQNQSSQQATRNW